MNLDDLSTQLLFTVVPLWVENNNGSQSMGTAFLYNAPHPSKSEVTTPLLVSNHHVIANASRIRLQFVHAVEGRPEPKQHLNVDIPNPSQLFPVVDESLDLATGPIGPVLNQLAEAKKAVFYRGISPDLVPAPEVLNDLSALEEVVFIGYPAGVRDERNWLPVIRRGVTATPPWNDFGGEPTFLLDAAVFPGSSGSPVFILNQGSYATRQGISIGSRLHFLGVITSTLSQVSTPGSSTLLNLGKAVRSTAVADFLLAAVASIVRTHEGTP